MGFWGGGHLFCLRCCVVVGISLFIFSFSFSVVCLVGAFVYHFPLLFVGPLFHMSEPSLTLSIFLFVICVRRPVVVGGVWWAHVRCCFLDGSVLCLGFCCWYLVSFLISRFHHFLSWGSPSPSFGCGVLTFFVSLSLFFFFLSLAHFSVFLGFFSVFWILVGFLM